MKTKYKIVLWLCLFLIVVIAVCLVLINIENNKKNDDLLSDDMLEVTEVVEDSLASATTTSAVRNITEEEGVQKQSQMAFEIYFPASWGNIEVVEGDFANQVKTVEYNIKTKDSSYQGGNVTIITIRQYEKSAPDKTGTVIVSNDNYDFYYTIWENAPSDLGQITEKELASVLETFKLLD